MFVSDATNLVTGDTNGGTDVFVRDRLRGITERVSVSSDEAQGNNPSAYPSISADGRFVAFTSAASNLVPADTNREIDVFLRDRLAGATERISVSSSGGQTGIASDHPSVSANGRFVAFSSYSTLLVSGDTNLSEDVFVRDRLLRTTERVSISSSGVQANDGSNKPTISNDGRFVAFVSFAANLAPGDLTGDSDAFVHDRSTGKTHLVSVNSNGIKQDGWVTEAAVSGSGRVVVFVSNGTNVVPGDTLAFFEVFVRDLETGVTERASVDSNGIEANTDAFTRSISADGRFVTFSSWADNLVTGDTNGVGDIFLRDRLTETTTRVSVSSAGLQGTDHSGASSSVSADGRFVAFSSAAANLVAGDSNNARDTFVRDRGNVPYGQDDLLVDFGNAGLWQRSTHSGWVRIHTGSPIAVAAGNLDGKFKDEAIASFSSLGLLARYDNTEPWTRLHSSVPNRFTVGDFDGNGIDDIVADIGSSGMWLRANNGSFVRLNSAVTQDLATGDLDANGSDELIADLGSRGLWVRYNNASWTQLHPASPLRIIAGDLDGDGKDELIADFSTGLWARYNNATWVKLNAKKSEGLAVGDLNGDGKEDVVGDFGSTGLWARYGGSSTWTKLHAQSPTNMIAADLDNNRKAEAVVDFGSGGLWARYNNASWVKLHNSPTQALAAGGFD